MSWGWRTRADTLDGMIRHILSDEGAFELRLVGKEGTSLENYQRKNVPDRQTSSTGNLMTIFNPYKFRMSK